MKINEETVLVGSKVVLVPYRKEHVVKYHEWMKSEEIRQQTASEPLTIDEEYEMQRSWQEDKDKLTFIVLAKEQSTSSTTTVEEILRSCSMVGDVNLFLSERQDDQEEGNTPEQTAAVYDAELEVMIAEPAWRHRGLAREALCLLIHYASTNPTPAPTHSGNTRSSPPSESLPLPCNSFLVKVGFDNEASIRLFEKLSFQEVKRSEIWKEVEMRPTEDGAQLQQLLPGPSAILHWSL